MMFDHIEKNKKNLGTLKAFGLSNYSITIVYSIISLVVISSIFIIGFIIAQLIGNYASNYVLLLSQISIANGMAIFLLNIDFKLLFWFIIFPLLSTTAFLIIKLRNKTPGDLIYERD
jgi:ABC-type antimicrobial peptide transport system permease subunit